MTLDMISQLLGQTRKDVGGPVPTAKEFPGQIPTPESVTPGSGGLLDPGKVSGALGGGGGVGGLLQMHPLVGALGGGGGGGAQNLLKMHPLVGALGGGGEGGGAKGIMQMHPLAGMASKFIKKL